ncbi:MAG: restriction endonuclease [Candidatus Pacebacteria bacterium]|nr:restriction endonuclease [Candidatus Paceibacterota bacterium]
MFDEKILIEKATGEKEYFDPTKLENSLLRSGANTAIVDEVLEEISKKITPGMTTKHIYTYAFSLLNKKDKPVAANYSTRRAVMDLGPSGFPFENLIAHMYMEMGYRTHVGRRIRGKCSEHEVDVLAYNEEEVILIEAKFHNQLGMRTDTKVALYVRARYEDLENAEIMLEGRKRKMTEGCLFTNTKFTKGAIDYASCAGVNLVGWNYPAKDNLNDLIEKTNIHPVTSLTSISKAQKLLLLEQGVVLLKNIKKNENLLGPLGLSSEKRKKVLDEINQVCND